MQTRRIIGYAALGFAALYGAVASAFAMDYLASNVTASAPAGIYIRDDGGDFATFCLSDTQAQTYGTVYCSPSNPEGRRILKPLIETRDDGLWVQSTHPNGLDSRLLGLIPFEQVRQRWSLLLEYKTWSRL